MARLSSFRSKLFIGWHKYSEFWLVRYNGLVWSNIDVTLLLPSYIYDPCSAPILDILDWAIILVFSGGSVHSQDNIWSPISHNIPVQVSFYSDARNISITTALILAFSLLLLISIYLAVKYRRKTVQVWHDVTVSAFHQIFISSLLSVFTSENESCCVWEKVLKRMNN